MERSEAEVRSRREVFAALRGTREEGRRTVMRESERERKNIISHIVRMQYFNCFIVLLPVYLLFDAIEM